MDGSCLLACAIVSHASDCFENCGEDCEWDNRDGPCDAEGTVHCAVIAGGNSVAAALKLLACGTCNRVNSPGVA